MNQQTEKHDSYYGRFRQKYYPFFWFVAAADEYLLEQCTAPEQDKQAGIGMAIICTTIAAMLSAYYAINSLFESWIYALPLALFWGVIIFNLDRFMVGSMRKNKKKQVGKELLLACPRIALAGLIATLISKPLEVKIFSNQIEGRVMSFNDEQKEREIKNSARVFESKKNERDKSDKTLKQMQIDARNVNLDPAYLSAKKGYDACVIEDARIRQKIDQKRAEIRRLINLATKENPRLEARQELKRDIGILTKARSELGCHIKKVILDKRGEEYLLTQAKRVEAGQRIKDALDSAVLINGKVLDTLTVNVAQRVNKAGNDILGQLRVLDKIKADDNEMYWASLLITALFFILEIAPIMIKILSPRGKYDSLLFLEEQRAFDREEAEEEESRQETNSRKQEAFKIREQLSDIDEQVRSKVRDVVLKAEADLAEKIVHAWQIQQEEELSANPQAYLNARIVTSRN